MEWTLTSVITAVGALAYSFQVKVSDNFTEPCFLFSVICGLPSSKKSRCIKLLKDHVFQLSKAHPDSLTVNNSNKYHEHFRHIIFRLLI